MPKGHKGYVTNLCCNCKEVKELNTSRYCRKCHNKNMREWRKNHPMSDEQRWKNTVRRKTRMRIQRGLLLKYPCEICKDVNVQAHHDDYNKPYDVRWLCPKHHREHHRSIK